jgi:maltooligosyltrehalose trehalohydrolase
MEGGLRADTESPATLGAVFVLSGVDCTVWAPNCESVGLKDVATDEVFALRKAERGYFEKMLYGMMPGRRYLLVLDGKDEIPDPASRFQPEGVHGPSEVIDTTAIIWKDDGWRGIELKDYIIYQIHAGTFSPGGTFTGAVDKLSRIKELGFTAIELMPFAEFPGSRGWGYDCVFPFAPHHSYGGPIGLKTLVEEAHKTGLAVIAGLAYPRHGNEGNNLKNLGPYYTDRYQIERGKALNFDGPQSDEVKRFFIENALYWVNDYHFDAIRISGIENIFDFTPDNILGQIATAVHTYAAARNRKVYVFGESDRNDIRLTTPHKQGGLGFDSQLNPDFHRALFAFATGRKKGVYSDFGNGKDVADAVRGFVYRGQYSKIRQRSHGSDNASEPSRRFVVTSENAVDIGRRPRGERLNKLIKPGQEKMIAGLLMLSPQTPLIFQGNEYGEKRPFLYFSEFTDEEIVRQERESAIARAQAFGLTGETHNPQAQETFARCKLDSGAHEKDGHIQIVRLYKQLIELRKSLNITESELFNIQTRFFDKLNCLFLQYDRPQSNLLMIFNIGGSEIILSEELPEGRWQCIFDSEADAYGGLGKIFPDQFTEVAQTRVMSVPPWSFAVYTAQKANS